jgi:adenine-specific DNA-methyltransferase
MPILNWIGKEKVINHHLDVPFHTLNEEYIFEDGVLKAPSPFGEGVGGEANKIIHADNLLALKSLLPQYEGRIKCIYIDPPYNTGNEGWVYNDNVNDPKFKKWLKSVVGKEGEDLTRHDKWLCMMYPRLKLLHKLLADDGAIFISIDDNEQANLKLIMDEIFGEINFVTNMPRITKKAGKTSDLVSLNNDYLICYKKNNLSVFNTQEHTDEGYKHEDEFIEERGKYKLSQTLDYGSIQYSASLDYEIEIEGLTLRPGNVSNEEMEKRKMKNPKSDFCWRWSRELYNFGLKNGFIVLRKSKNGYRIYTKTYQNATISKERSTSQYFIEYQERKKAITTLDFIENIYSNDNSRKEIVKIFDTKVFEYSKPSKLIEKIIQISTDKNSIILDSFAGSGTTAHAVLNLNKQDGGNRKFILVEMEDYAESITAERVKRVINGYGHTPNPSQEGNNNGTGGGFTYYTMGQRVLDDEDNLNPHLALHKIQQYIWYAETRTPFLTNATAAGYLGKYNYTGIYFNYKPNEVTVLNDAYLVNITEPCEQYIVYADMCLLPEKLMEKHNIIFKKIPRDISKL